MHKTVRLGELIKELRVRRDLPLRKVAAILGIDTSTLSKIEKGERYVKREMIKPLSEFFDQDYQEMLVTFLSDKIAYQLKEEDCGITVLKVAQEKIIFLKKEIGCKL